MTALAKDSRPNLSSEKILHKDYYRKCLVVKITDHESQGAWRQNELIGGKPPLMK
jgi:hypothetical protein